MILCDFCSNSNTKWRYHAHDTGAIGVLQIPGIPLIDLGSRGDWAACDPCHGMIERGDWDALLTRALENAPDVMQLIPHTVLRETFRAIHASFRHVRFGDPEPIA